MPFTLISFRTFQLAFTAAVLKAIWKMQQVKGKNLHPETAPAVSCLPLRVSAPHPPPPPALGARPGAQQGGSFWPRGVQGRSPGRAEDAEAKSSPAGALWVRGPQCPEGPLSPQAPQWAAGGSLVPSLTAPRQSGRARRVQGVSPTRDRLPPGRTRSCRAWCPLAVAWRGWPA